MFTPTLLHLILRTSAVSAILVAACCVFGIWQPSTELAYTCQQGMTICLTDADRGMVFPLVVRSSNIIADSTDIGEGYYVRTRATNLSWSPDGNWLAYTRRYYAENDLYLLNLRTRETTPLAEFGHHPAWSPDGQSIVYGLWNEERNASDIYIASLDGTSDVTSRLLWQSDGRLGGTNPAWSPDGRWIAFQASARFLPTVIYVVSIEDGSAHTVTNPNGIYFDPAWSPDGRTLALHEGFEQNLVLLDLESGAVQTLDPKLRTEQDHRLLDSYNGSPSWSPDGSRIAFDTDADRGSDTTTAWQIYVMNADGSNAYAVANGQRPAWRPPRVFSWEELLN